MHLASDAVRAAAESPFLDGALAAASGVLCSIDLPPLQPQFDTGAGSSAELQSMQARNAAAAQLPRGPAELRAYALS